MLKITDKVYVFIRVKSAGQRRKNIGFTSELSSTVCHSKPMKPCNHAKSILSTEMWVLYQTIVSKRQCLFRVGYQAFSITYTKPVDRVSRAL